MTTAARLSSRTVSVANDNDEPPSYADVTTHDVWCGLTQGITVASANPVEEVSSGSNTQANTTPKTKNRGTSIITSHPRVAVVLGVKPFWNPSLLVCRVLAVTPALWWGLRYAFIFLRELLFGVDGMLDSGAWSVEKRFRVTEVFLAILWCSASGYLSYFFADCLMGRWLLIYTPGATVVRMLTTNALIAYISSWVLWLAGASNDPRMLLPAWISISTTLTMLYHLTQRKININRETTASISVLSIASFITMCSLLLQLHLTRENDPVIPFFMGLKKTWSFCVGLGI